MRFPGCFRAFCGAGREDPDQPANWSGYRECRPPIGEKRTTRGLDHCPVTFGLGQMVNRSAQPSSIIPLPKLIRPWCLMSKESIGLMTVHADICPSAKPVRAPSPDCPTQYCGDTCRKATQQRRDRGLLARRGRECPRGCRGRCHANCHAAPPIASPGD